MKTFPFYIVISAALLTACNNKAATAVQQPQTAENSALPPVETEEPNTKIKPAFKGQTRIAGARTSTPYQTKIISKDLNRPWGITSLPDGRLIITEKEGTFRIAKTDGTLSAAITGAPKVHSNGQGGLLDVLVDPKFSENRTLYWTFSEDTGPGNLTAVAKGQLSVDEKKIENAVVIYRATPAFDNSMHFGSRLIMDRSGNLVVSTGERSDLKTRPDAQSLTSAYGKIIRITTDGKPAAGNPFLNKSDARPEFYSYGHRNPQGLALHPVTGDIWENEMGPKGGDEVNIIRPGKNYGWPTITYGEEYSGETIGQGIGQKDGLEQPVYYWDPVTSPSGMTFYSRDVIPEWKNNLFIGGMSSKHIIRLVIENDKVVGEERLLSNEGQRFRDIAEGNDGALYAVTDEGRLYRIGK